MIPAQQKSALNGKQPGYAGKIGHYRLMPDCIQTSHNPAPGRVFFPSPAKGKFSGDFNDDKKMVMVMVMVMIIEINKIYEKKWLFKAGIINKR